jgi:16S rRNA (cytosine967-C5)-methyltransferase
MVKKSRSADRVRIGAARILARWQREHVHVEDLVDRHDHETERASGAAWDYAERRRLRELVFSCVRLRSRYDHIVSRRSKKSRTPAPELRAIFWIALHELTELDHKPHAVVDEAVRLTEALDVGYARGFVNGLLRGYLREPEGDFSPPKESVEYASTWLSHPRWLAERWAEALGAEEMIELCAANNERPRLYLRARPGRRDVLAKQLGKFGWETAEPEFLPDGLELLTRVPPALLLSQVDEPCMLQDAAAQLVSPILAAARPTCVLDLCAAPGGKATHLADLLPESVVVAVDGSARRLARLAESRARLGLQERLRIAVGDAARPPFAVGRFDAILLDVPCTGTGVLARRHDARWVRRPEHVRELGALQRVLLDAAVDLLRPGGVVVYATCSLEPEENDEVVDFVLSRREDVREWPIEDEAPAAFVRDGRLSTWPHRHGIDGAFAARLRKRSEAEGAES